jgi:hypothetical protein
MDRGSHTASQTPVTTSAPPTRCQISGASCSTRTAATMPTTGRRCPRVRPRGDAAHSPTGHTSTLSSLRRDRSRAQPPPSRSRLAVSATTRPPPAATPPAPRQPCRPARGACRRREGATTEHDEGGEAAGAGQNQGITQPRRSQPAAAGQCHYRHPRHGCCHGRDAPNPEAFAEDDRGQHQGQDRRRPLQQAGVGGRGSVQPQVLKQKGKGHTQRTAKSMSRQTISPDTELPRCWT